MRSRRHATVPRTSGIVGWTAAIAAVAIALSGCGPSEPPDAAALFAANCAVCHGPAGQGVDDQGPSLLADSYLAGDFPDEDLAAAIRNGVASSDERWAPMPGFPRFDDDQLDAVVGYVRELQRRAALSDG
ncbi:MAG: c-type cytochrome [Nitriliruptoraceae bacterium]